MNHAQKILELMPVLPDTAVITGARTFLALAPEDRTGFFHSNGEWNFLVKFDGHMYRVPMSNMELRALAETRMTRIGD